MTVLEYDVISVVHVSGDSIGKGTDTFYTNDEGYLVTPEKLEYGSGYSLVEVSAPYGYVLNSDPYG